jgi:hypothetical protein
MKGELTFGNMRFHGAFTVNGGALTMVDKNLFIVISDE